MSVLLGEALGINVIRKNDIEAFKLALNQVAGQAYFEAALELLTVNWRLVLT